MRDKIVFFILGAVIATIAYLIGDLETLTAEDKNVELDLLHVNRLVVKEGMVVGDYGKKFIIIETNKEYAHITLYGGTATEESFGNIVDDVPNIRLEVRSNHALIEAASHNKRPEAKSVLGVANFAGKKYKSFLRVEDLDGTNDVFN